MTAPLGPLRELAVAAALLSFAASASAGTCSGTVTYTDRLFGLSGFTGTTTRPARYVDVFLYTSNLVTLIGSGETDGAGYFSFPTTNLGVIDVRLVVAADSDNSPWTTRLVVYDEAVDPDVQSVASGAVSRDTGASFIVDYTIPRLSGNIRTGDPFNIIDVLLDSAEEVFLRTESMVQECRAYWKDGSDDGTYFVPGDQSLHLYGGTAGSPDSGDNDGYDDTVIIHEYGHFLSFNYSRDDTPGGYHTSTGYYLPTQTWSEGWATFWNLCVRDSAVYWDSLSGDAGFAIDFENGSPSANLRIGMNNESAVAMALYDIFDSAVSEDTTPGSDDETLAYGLDSIWAVFDDFMDNSALLVTLLDMYQGWKSLFPDADVDRAYVGRQIEFVADSTDSVAIRYPLNLAIPDASPSGVSDSLQIERFNGEISEARVFVCVRHSRKGDLVVGLRHPDGTEVLLHDRRGATEDHIIEWYGYPNYQVPEQSLAALAGKPFNGTWTLVVADQVAGTTGQLKSWGIRFENAKPDPQSGVIAHWKVH